MDKKGYGNIMGVICINDNHTCKFGGSLMPHEQAISKVCKTCEHWRIEESNEWMCDEPCCSCIRNPYYKDCWEIEPSILSREGKEGEG